MQQAKHISRYIKNVKKVFPWGYPNKKKILKELKNNLKLFFNEHPDVSYEDLCLHFGTPDSYIDDRMSLMKLINIIRHSAIQNNETVYAYIPSSRMRDLLTKYLNNELRG